MLRLTRWHALTRKYKSPPWKKYCRYFQISVPQRVSVSQRPPEPRSRRFHPGAKGRILPLFSQTPHISHSIGVSHFMGSNWKNESCHTITLSCKENSLLFLYLLIVVRGPSVCGMWILYTVNSILTHFGFGWTSQMLVWQMQSGTHLGKLEKSSCYCQKGIEYYH